MTSFPELWSDGWLSLKWSYTTWATFKSLKDHDVWLLYVTAQCKVRVHCSETNPMQSSKECTVYTAGNLEGTHSTVVSSPGLCFTTQHLDSSHTDKSIQSTSFEGPPRFPECENDDDGDEKQCTRPMMMGMPVLYCCFGLERQ